MKIKDESTKICYPTGEVLSEVRLKSKPLTVFCETELKEISNDLYCKAADLTTEKKND